MNIISGRQAAKKAGMRYSTFMEYVLAGDIPARRVENRNWEIPEELLDEWISSRKETAIHEAIAQAEERKKGYVDDAGTAAGRTTRVTTRAVRGRQVGSDTL